MRASVWVGIALIVAGVAVYLRGGFTRSEEVVDVGPLEVTKTERQNIPPWLAGIGMGLSSLLVVLNALRLVADEPRARGKRREARGERGKAKDQTHAPSQSSAAGR